MSEEGDKPKIIVDDDWKTRAQEEKEQLQQAAEAENEPAAVSDSDAEPQEQSAPEPHEEMPLPPASFPTLITSIATQALAMMGQIPLQDGKPVVRLDHAKHHIDTLAILEEKTKDNLEASEMVMLNNILHELRMVYVAVSNQAAPES